MRSMEGVVEATGGCFDDLAAIDLSQVSDSSLRGGLLQLLNTQNRIAAQVIRTIGEFDRRGLAPADGHRSTKAWLQAFARLSGHTAHANVRTLRTLRLLPDVAAAFADGTISAEHVEQFCRLHDREPDHIVARVERILLGLATTSDPSDLRKACDHVRYAAHANDGPEGPDPDARAFERRQLTLSRVGDLWHVAGQLDPETGALLRTALEAYTPPPAEGEPRTAAQRRHDALHTLVSQSLEAGRPPTTGGHRPQLGLIVPLHILVDLPDPHQAGPREAGPHQAGAHRSGSRTAQVDEPAPAAQQTPGTAQGRGFSGVIVRDLARCDETFGATRPRGAAAAVADSHIWDPGACTPSCTPANGGRVNGVSGADDVTGAGAGDGDSRDSAGGPSSWFDELHRLGGFPDLDAPHGGLGPQPAYLEGWGPVNSRLVQRLACDSTLYRVILDPKTGLPLDVGRAYRCAPPWIRKALWIRDRHCRWPGCKTEASWCDAHHYVRWNDQNGPTAVDNLILLCRYHHVLVHEGRWGLHFDPATAEVRVTRPDGRPYELGPTRPHQGATPGGPARGDPPPPGPAR
jgi:hypothetical protein